MLRRDTVILYETSGSKHRSKHISLKSKGDVSVRENKYPMAMKVQAETWEHQSFQQLLKLWVILPRAALPWCSCHQQLRTDPKDPTSPFQTSLTVWDTAAELLLGFLQKEKGYLMW